MMKLDSFKKDLLFWFSRKLNRPLVSPDTIQISLTYRCNLRCKMCSIVNLLPETDEIPTDMIYRIIDQAAAYGINKLVLTGGEPFLRSDIFKICDYSHKKGLFNIVTTNGILISDSLAEEIVVSKINHLHFSIDGKEKSHDFFRGEGTFRKAVDAITRIRDRRTQRNIFSIGIACTVMDTNVHELFELLKLSEELGVESMSYQPVIANNADFSVGDISSYWPSEKKLPMLRSEIEQIRAYKPKRLKVCDEPRLELLLKYYNKELTRRDWICFGGFKTVFICYEKMDPLVYSCHGVCGNLRNISLKKAWESEEAHRLRIHSGSCKKLCLQGCYSYEKAQSLANLIFHN